VIRDVLEQSLRDALAALGVDAPETVQLERPARREHGDWSSNLALATAKAAGRNPRDLAAAIVDWLTANPPTHVEQVEIAGPGFVNFRLHASWLHEVLTDVIVQGEDEYARFDLGRGERVQVEFVSANPTGPIHVGNGWFASYGDSIARLLERTGYDVTREYYVNDTGGQIRRLGESVLARRSGRPVPEDGYPSGFVKGLASAYDGSEDIEEAGRWAAERILGFIRHQMHDVHIDYDVWFSQASIEESEAVGETMGLLAEATTAIRVRSAC
jgi:arginyl-tRNA synthetase